VPKRSAEYYFDTLVDQFNKLAEQDFMLALEVINLRQMLAHRGLSISRVAQGIHRSTRWVYFCLAGALYSVDDSELGEIGRASYFDAIEIVEDFVTRETDKAGGIPVACCSNEAYEGYKYLLRFSPSTRREFR